ncbi:hypothetical protein EMIT047CA2_20296 [Pseudomonas soli]
MIGVTLGTCIDDTGYPHAQLLETVQRIKFAQHRGAPEGMQKAAVDMPDLAFRIQHVAVVITQSLHAALAATPLVGFLDPFPLLLPVKIELSGLMLRYRHDPLPLAQYVNSPHGIERQKVETFLDSEAS